MISHPHSQNPDSGSRLHFLIAAIIAIVIAIGLTSTAAQAGLTPAAEALTESSTPVASVALSTIEASVPAAATGPEHAAPHYLEEEQEFAPKFQHIVPRTRAAHRLTLNTLACSLSIAQHCAPTTRL